MRDIDLIVVHCSASDQEEHDNIKTIRGWHLERGFDDIGYHFIILKSGEIVVGRQLHLAGAHCKYHNARSIGICLTGEYNFSDKQFLSLNKLCLSLMIQFNLERKDILAHKDLNANKTCPNFDLLYALNFMKEV